VCIKEYGVFTDDKLNNLYCGHLQLTLSINSIICLMFQISEKCSRSVNKCSELEKEVLELNQEKKVLCEKTLKYDQLLDQKRRIEDIVDQMKSTEVFILY